MPESDHFFQPSIFVGTGGARPGLIAYEVASGRSTRLLSLPAHQSVYAVATSADRATIAAGTRMGAIHWLGPTGERDQDDGSAPRGQMVGTVRAPVVALTFVGEGLLAVSDTARRCLLWRLGQERPWRALPTEGRTICALFCPDPGQLAGLALSCELVVWDYSKGEISEVTAIPTLPPVGALVKPVYWPAADAWAWPGAGGTIVFYEWRQHKLSEIAAHRGEVYAVMVCKDELLTIGRSDGCLQRWSGPQGPADSVPAPRGVVSAALWPGDRTAAIVVVEEAGQARVLSWDGRQLEAVSDLPGMAYRAAVSPDVAAYESALRQRQARRARELAVQVRDKITRRQRSDLEPLYRELAELGYTQVVLALRGEQARADEDLLAELRAHRELAGLLAPQESASVTYLSRYAELLEILWQPQRAAAVYRQLLAHCSSHSEYQKRADRLGFLAEAMTGEQSVIESDQPAATLLEAALVLGAELQGRYLLRQVGTPIHCGVIISAGDLLRQYEQITREGCPALLPHGEQKELWWLSRGEPYRVPMVVFRGAETSSFPWLELGVKLCGAQLQTVLTPVVLLNAGGWPSGVSVAEHHRQLLQELRRAQEQSLASGWLQAVYRRVKYAIRQAVSGAWPRGPQVEATDVC